MGCNDRLQSGEELEYDILRSRLIDLVKECERISLAEFIAGDAEMIIYCYGGQQRDLHRRPSNAALEAWITRLEEIKRRDQ